MNSCVATVFPRHHTLVTLPGIHATQRMAFLEHLDAERIKAGCEPLSSGERAAVWADAVDLIMQDNRILIRPNPENIALMFEADVVLQQLVSKRQIRFLSLKDERIRMAVKRRGECWRITPLPKSQAEMQQMIRASKIGIAGLEIYYYNTTTGTRWLTCEQFAGLDKFDEGELQRHLLEIQQHCMLMNESGNPEVDFFVDGKDPEAGSSKAGKILREEWLSLNISTLEGVVIRQTYRRLQERFAELIAPALRADDPDNPEWRRGMFGSLFAYPEDSISEEMLLGLSSEFFMQIEWLPGVRIEGDEVLLDAVYSEPVQQSVGDGPPCDAKARAFIMNLVREYEDLEYVNVGRVPQRLSNRPHSGGRREVYLVEMKRRMHPEEIVKIIRLQKWGVWERLDEGKNLQQAILETEEYTEYVLDRRLGCRQVGMRLPARIIPRKIIESYEGRQQFYRGWRIWSPYFEREYIHGIATDKIPLSRFEDQAFALGFAALLGRAAAPNIVVGRSQDLVITPGEKSLRIMFDDGDEILLEDGQRQPTEIVLTDHTGSFWDYQTPLEQVADQYALPILRRAPYVLDARAFAEAYLAAFYSGLRHIQDEFRRETRAFLNLFVGRSWDDRGSFSDRWPKVLQRLDRTDPVNLVQLIRGAMETELR